MIHSISKKSEEPGLEFLRIFVYSSFISSSAYMAAVMP